MIRKEQIHEGLKRIYKDLQGFETKLIAVSKTKPLEDIEYAYHCGQKIFGENKVQELLEKAQSLNFNDIQWHFIGHLQSNKINMLLKTPNLVSIHSVDSIKLLQKLLSKKVDDAIGVFLQVNTSCEDEKSGFKNLEELEKAIELLNEHEDFYFQGLMTIGKIRTEDFAADAHKCFSKLLKYKELLCSKYPRLKVQLSMGMSSDYPIALKLGSDWIRIGSDIFGTRTL